jgi:hypothetical protein
VLLGAAATTRSGVAAGLVLQQVAFGGLVLGRALSWLAVGPPAGSASLSTRRSSAASRPARSRRRIG